MIQFSLFGLNAELGDRALLSLAKGIDLETLAPVGMASRGRIPYRGDRRPGSFTARSIRPVNAKNISPRTKKFV